MVNMPLSKLKILFVTSIAVSQDKMQQGWPTLAKLAAQMCPTAELAEAGSIPALAELINTRNRCNNCGTLHPLRWLLRLPDMHKCKSCDKQHCPACAVEFNYGARSCLACSQPICGRCAAANGQPQICLNCRINQPSMAVWTES
jgi:hypothetical protein